MRFDIWNWFRDTYEKVVGNAVARLTEADGQPGLSWEDISVTADLIKKAEVNFGTGTERREWVLGEMTKVRKVVIPHLIELAFWTALNYANKRGWVHLKE